MMAARPQVAKTIVIGSGKGDPALSLKANLTILRTPDWLYRLSVAPLMLVPLTPLIIDRSLYFPFVSGKVFFFRTLVEVSLAAFLLLAARTPRFRVRADSVLVCAALFVAVQLVAGAIGVDFSRSLWGDLERAEGLLTTIHLFAYFVLLTALMRSREDWLLLVSIWLGTSVVVAALAFLEQSRQLDGGYRPGSTLGNAAFLAGYLMVGVFLALWFRTSLRSLPSSIVTLLVAVWLSAALVLTATRSALVGGLAGAAWLLAAFLVRRRRRLPSSLFRVFAVSLALSLVLVALREPLGELTLAKRLSTISSSLTTRFRLLTWEAALDSLPSMPAFGYGPENFSVAFDRRFPPELFTLYPEETKVDRAHNSLLDVAVTSGAVGTLAFLGMYAAIFVALFRRRTIRRPSTTILAAAIFAHFTESLFSVPSLPAQLGFWMLAAMATEAPGGAGETGREQTTERLRSRHSLLAAGLLSGTLLTAAVFQFNIRPEETCRLLSQAAKEGRENHRDQAVQLFSRAIRREGSYSDDARKALGSTVVGWLSSDPAGPIVLDKHIQRAIGEMEQVVKEHPLDLNARMLLAMLYNRGAAYDPARADLAGFQADEALRLSPTFPPAYFERGQAYLFNGDFALALVFFRRAVQLAPASLQARWNLAVALVAARRDIEADAQFRRLQEEGHDLSKPYLLRRLLAVCQSFGRTEKIPGVLTRLAEMEPDNPTWRRMLEETQPATSAQ